MSATSRRCKSAKKKKNIKITPSKPSIENSKVMKELQERLAMIETGVTQMRRKVAKVKMGYLQKEDTIKSLRIELSANLEQYKENNNNVGLPPEMYTDGEPMLVDIFKK